MNLHYFDTLIAVAEDCPVTRGTAPTGRGGQPTVATLQYAMLADRPYVHTQEDVLFDVWWARQVRPPAAERARLRAEFFARPQACLRASPLPKQFGWGLLFDARGKLALCAMESAEYRRLVAGDRVKVVRAMRACRA